MTLLAFSSKLSISPQDFWAQQSLATVNYELGPWIHMTAPAAWRRLRLADWNNHSQQPLFASWVLLLGLLPVDRHAFGSFNFQPDTGFVELSSSWVNRLWRHARTVEARGSGCVVRDSVTFAPRIGVMAPVLHAIYALVFRHRHNRLLARYGGTRISS